MPIYSYECEEHGAQEAYHRVADIDQPTPCPVCGAVMRRNVIASGVAGRGDYAVPVVSDAMGFLAEADDIAEHRRRFPKVELEISDGTARPKFRSLSQKRQYMDTIGWVDRRDYR